MARVCQEGDEMMNSLFFRLNIIMLGASLSIIPGCASTAPSRFYLLNPLPRSGTESRVEADSRCVSLGIGPIELPEYLDRSQIVSRISQNEVRLAEFDQWAEPLDHNFSNVLAENLSILLCVDHIAFFPWRRDISIDYQLVVEVTRFDGKLGGDALLSVYWTLLSEDGKPILKKQSSFREPCGAPDYEALVSAQSRALGRLSREIADAIETSRQSVSGQ
jgi:uncharacterized lipoprotein YmbA